MCFGREKAAEKKKPIYLNYGRVSVCSGFSSFFRTSLQREENCTIFGVCFCFLFFLFFSHLFPTGPKQHFSMVHDDRSANVIVLFALLSLSALLHLESWVLSRGGCDVQTLFALVFLFLWGKEGGGGVKKGGVSIFCSPPSRAG